MADATRGTSVKVVGAIAGLIAGHVLWLLAISVGDELMPVSQWSLAVFLLSAGLAVSAVMVGLLMNWRRKRGWSAFAFGVPVLPVVLSLALLANLYF